MHASELQQQVTQPVILCQQNVPLGDRRIALDKCCVAIGNCPQHQRPQRFDAFGQALQVVAGESVTQRILRGNRRFEIPFTVWTRVQSSPSNNAANRPARASSPRP